MMSTDIAVGPDKVFVSQLGKIYGTGTVPQQNSNTFLRVNPTNFTGEVDFETISQIGKYARSTQSLYTIDQNGDLWSLGSPYGRLSSDGLFAKIPSDLVESKKFIDVVGTSYNSNSRGYSGAMALAEDGSVYYWGNVGTSTVGVPSSGPGITATYPTKADMPAILNAKKIFYTSGDTRTSGGNVFVLDQEGRVWSWGSTGRNMLGRNISETGENRLPALMDFTTKIVKFAVSQPRALTLALDENGDVWSWSTSGGYALPYKIIPKNSTDPIIDIAVTSAGSANETLSIVIYESGKVEAWGRNLTAFFYPNIGNIGGSADTRTELPMPEPIKKAGVISSNGSKYFAYFVAKSRRVYSLGYNSQTAISRLGTGQDGTVNNDVPTEVIGLPLENLFTITAKNEAGEDIPGISADIIRIETLETEPAQIGENYVLGHGTFEITAYGAPEGYNPVDSQILTIDTQGKEYNIDFVFKESKIDFQGSITVSSNVPNTVFIGNKDIVFENGVAEISQPGNYKVTALAEGYYSQTVSISVPDASDEADVTYAFELERIPEPEPEPDQEDDYWLSNQPYFNRENLNIGEAK